MNRVKRYIFSFKGQGQMPEEDVQLLHDCAHVVDASRRAVLVETDTRKILNELTARLTDWSVSEEKYIPLPSVQYRVR
ncbi:MAG: hypothetical protein EAZ91_06485 [Cytophagales bacterium]|nr:MAG: hypothetical protein EAZ91_06485 [Cytophagales bacterium]